MPIIGKSSLRARLSSLRSWTSTKTSIVKDIARSLKVLSSVSKKLDYLVVGERKPTKKKIDQAKDLNIKIISEKEWDKILNN